jgi:mono/diheme cytochrome c family protein
MRAPSVCLLGLSFVVGVPALRAQEPPPAPAPPPTYAADVAAILNQNCVSCHRKGEIGPMPLTTYREVRPYARAIRDGVVERRMPPWHADPKYGHFANERRLSETDIRTLVRWVEGGAPEGNTALLPAAPRFVEGWTIGQPDIEIPISKPFEVPADGTVDYQYVVSPTGFKEDKWVSAAEVRPGNREVVHHVIVFVLPPEGQSSEPGRERDRFGTSCPQARPDERQMKELAERVQSGREPRDFGVQLVGWAPGLQGTGWPAGSAKRIPAGSRLLFQLHYTPSGTPAVDRDTKVGLVLAKGPVTSTIHTLPISNRQIVIPPGDPNYEASACFTFNRDVELIEFMPHMHYRGKDFTYRVTFPDGRAETLLSVPRYDFSWQTAYRLAEPLPLARQARIDCTAHYDNSARNRDNPDATKEVRWGDQTWEEMLIGWITVTMPAGASPTPTDTAAIKTGS